MKKLVSTVLILCLLVGLNVGFYTVEAKASAKVESMLSAMSLREKITQMMMMSFQSWTEDPSREDPSPLTKITPHIRQILSDYDFGAVIYFAANLPTTESTFALTRNFQSAATRNGGIPMLVATDQEGGNVVRLNTGTALPGNMALGATGNPEYAYTAGKIVGSELSVLGINTDLAPVVDVNNNANNPVIGLRSYSDDPETVGRFAGRFIDGLNQNNVVACAKHFPGHGDTATDSHYGLPLVKKSYNELKSLELKPFSLAIETGVDMIMTAHILYPKLEKDTAYSSKTGKQESLPATMSDDIITGILKGDMGFDGVVCTDAMNMAGVAANWDIAEAAVIAINAGVDLLCMPVMITDYSQVSQIEDFVQAVAHAVEQGTIPMSRIDDACRRILTLKEKRGILSYRASDYSLKTALATVGCDSHKEAEREMAAKAVTVVKNKNNTLPLTVNKKESVLFLTPYDNETGLLAMGWNRVKATGLIPDTAKVKILRYDSADIAPYKKAVEAADKVVIVSEISRVSSVEQNAWVYAAPKALTAYAKEKGKTTVVMSVDKPYDVQLYGEADAILAVYGCRGASIDPTEALLDGTTKHMTAFGPNFVAGVEVLMGEFGAVGKLPVTIPKLDRSTGTYTAKKVYEFGYGLTYDSLLQKDEEQPERTDESAVSEETIASGETVSSQPAASVQSTVAEPEATAVAVATPSDIESHEEPSENSLGWLWIVAAAAVIAVTVWILIAVKTRKKP